MRRLALSVLTACGLAILSACSGGTGLSLGTGNGSNPTQVIITNGSGALNDFFLAPTGAAPISATATAQSGSGPTAQVLPNATFTWAARFVTATDLTNPNVGQYLVGPSPNGFKTCSLPASTPAVPIFYIAPGSVGLTPLPIGQSSNQVYVAPVAGVAAPYCLVLQATASPGGQLGAVTIVVSNSP